MVLLEENRQVKVRVLGFEGTRQCVLIGRLTDASDDDELWDDAESDEVEQQGAFKYKFKYFYVLLYLDAQSG